MGSARLGMSVAVTLREEQEDHGDDEHRAARRENLVSLTDAVDRHRPVMECVDHHR